MDWSVLKVSSQKTEHQHIDHLTYIYFQVEHAFYRVLRESPQRHRYGRVAGYATGRGRYREPEEVRSELVAVVSVADKEERYSK